MRVWSRIALIVVVVVSAPLLTADHFQGNCPLSFVDAAPASSDIETSPHGVFRSGNSVFVLRGNILSTYTTTDIGDLVLAREDFIGSLGARESEGGVAFSGGYLFLSTEAGLEIYDLRNVRAGGNAPILVTRRAGLHYRRLAASGNRLVGLFPATDLPCNSGTGGPSGCTTSIDIYNITTINNPTLIGTINSRLRFLNGFNDVALNFGYVVAVTDTNLYAFDISNPAAAMLIANEGTGGEWLLSNGGDFLLVGTDEVLTTYRVDSTFFPFFTRTKILGAPLYLGIGRGNPIRFSRHAYWDEANARLITMVDEVDQMTGEAARTIAFDVFDYTVLQVEGSAERVYEDVTMVTDDEVKFNPVAVGSFVYVVGEETGLQTWGACGQITGRIELDSPQHLTCGGAEIHGWVTGVQKVVNVELFLGATPLGAAQVGGPERTNVSSSTPVFNWRLNVNLDATARGEYTLRAVGTDILGNRKQFASKRIFFAGPGQNCTTPRRRAVR